MNTHDHILKSFDSELDRLYDEIKQMGDLAISQLNAAVDVLGRRDSNAAARVVANDDAIDALENAISMDVLKLLALRQPMANDLRQVVAALKMTGDLERMGDYAANVEAVQVRPTEPMPFGILEKSPRPSSFCSLKQNGQWSVLTTDRSLVRR